VAGGGRGIEIEGESISKKKEHTKKMKKEKKP
jgi:hypothetical protein